ncbi:Heavy metal-associated isoprenylated plant protein 41 [Linum perenne]
MEMMMMTNGGQVHRRATTHYSPDQQILLVGEGDFSFSLSLAAIFGSASNIVATSLDTKYELVKKYKNAESNVATLKRMGAQVYHGVDATQMKSFADLSMRKFDRIIFNFPHAGFHGREGNMCSYICREHSKLMQGFFKNAAGMLRPFGEVHVSHKTTEPYCHWKIEELAFGCSLALRECVKFNKVDYPWYSNKRGDGTRSDEPFLLGECSTFKFAVTRYSEFTRMAMNMAMNTRHQNGIPCPRYQLGDSSVPCHNQLHFNHPFSAQDGGAINLRAGIVHEAAGSSFERTMVPTPRTLNQQPLYNEYQQNLRSLWLLLVSLYGQHPQVAARDMNPS